MVSAAGRTEAEAEQLAVDGAQTAISLVARIRAEDAATIWDHLAGLSRDHLHATVVALAAMVPVDADPEQLLAWVEVLAVHMPTPAEARARVRQLVAAHATDPEDEALLVAMLALDEHEKETVNVD